MTAGSKGKLPPIIMESHAIHRFAEVREVAAAIDHVCKLGLAKP